MSTDEDHCQGHLVTYNPRGHALAVIRDLTRGKPLTACTSLSSLGWYLSTSQSPNVALMLGQRRIRWPNVKPKLGDWLVFNDKMVYVPTLGQRFLCRPSITELFIWCPAGIYQMTSLWANETWSCLSMVLCATGQWHKSQNTPSI